MLHTTLTPVRICLLHETSPGSGGTNWAVLQLWIGKGSSAPMGLGRTGRGVELLSSCSAGAGALPPPECLELGSFRPVFLNL